jgi:hypothetical protein
LLRGVVGTQPIVETGAFARSFERCEIGEFMNKKEGEAVRTVLGSDLRIGPATPDLVVDRFPFKLKVACIGAGDLKENSRPMPLVFETYSGSLP